MKLTLEKIEEYGPCGGQYELVKAHFPNGVPLTAASVRKCRRLGIDRTWAEGMLSPEALKAYKEAVATAWKAYKEAVTPARKAHEEVVATALKAYEEAVTPARKAYKEVTATALLEGLKKSL